MTAPLEVVPLGGVGEFGKNVLWLRSGGSSILLEWDAEIPSFEETHADALRAKDFLVKGTS